MPPKKKSKPTPKPVRNDKEVIDNPNLWQSWPFLPMKKPPHPEISNKTLGCLIETEEHQAGMRIIYHGNMYRWPETSEGVEALPKTEFTNTDALLRAGWIID